MEIILKYFPDLSETQKEQFAALGDLYTDWNSKINVISRKDIGNLYEHHVLHSLGIAKTVNFRPDTEIMDLGTGGGFPGVPLAILFPEDRAEECNDTPLQSRRRETHVRFRCKPCRNALARLAENRAEEHQERAAQCLAQRLDLLERRRIATRNPIREASSHGDRPERVLPRSVFRDQKGNLCLYK